MTTIVTVLREGPEYGAKEAQYLHQQLRDYDAVCLSNIAIPGVNVKPLQQNWPGWWSKIELFNPEGPLGEQDLFYIDIDTLITGDLTPLLQQSEMTMLTNFYSEGEKDPIAASGIMFIPVKVKQQIWDAWWRFGPEKAMKHFVHHPGIGDQGFINHAIPTVNRWQDVAPKQIISYKKDVACKGMPGYHNRRSLGNGHVPEGTRIVCFHGNPRPWQVHWQALLPPSPQS